MFQFTAFPFCKLWIYLQMTELFSAGFPHSDICGSIPICDSPQLFAAYHVLLRLPVPRHSPCALSCLTVITFVISECSSVYISFFFFRCVYLFLDYLSLSMFSFQGAMATNYKAVFRAHFFARNHSSNIIPRSHSYKYLHVRSS